MRGARPAPLLALAAIMVLAHPLAHPLPAGADEIGGARLEPLSYDDLPGWAADDHEAALAAFRVSCAPILDGRAALRPAAKAGIDLLAACRAALEVAPGGARAFFERTFVPHRIVPHSGRGFLTGYYEPELEGSLVPTARFATPLRGRPAALVTLAEGESVDGVDPSLRAALADGAGGHVPVPTRAEIEAGALDAQAQPVVWLEEPGEAFIVHVQGSARIRLPDGAVMRVGYAGRNGHPYTSIGRLLVERGEIERDEMSLERLLAWLRENGAAARALMHENASYIFFTRLDGHDPALGPIGGAGVALTPERSIAVDRGLWPYGLPFYLTGALPDADGEEHPLARLVIAQDTGSAILGPARGDYFTGSGARAGTRAGLIRHATDFVVLLPRRAANGEAATDEAAR
ncbi:murein transglycosylase A [Salinarimonas ramus]|uniref:peptidoglycan lytic exotransglycosylase n=1 Tax=Salinarimonas ramus TaxID=690164 RepID=A0A917QJF1_9HYPH|nr:MltA domain-containing protein [Salinarimonas ramus]GGK53576.1 transglycosylase [Salinarimonas ramus]